MQDAHYFTECLLWALGDLPYLSNDIVVWYLNGVSLSFRRLYSFPCVPSLRLWACVCSFIHVFVIVSNLVRGVSSDTGSVETIMLFNPILRDRINQVRLFRLWKEKMLSRDFWSYPFSLFPPLRKEQRWTKRYACYDNVVIDITLHLLLVALPLVDAISYTKRSNIVVLSTVLALEDMNFSWFYIDAWL